MIRAKEFDAMGTQHGGDDLPPEGERPPDRGLPELPPGWGEIPDDPSELAAEAEQLRAERSGALPAPAPAAAGPGLPRPSAGMPLLIMSIAVLVTLISLFLMTWSGSGAPPGQRGGSADELPSITLADPNGRQVALAAQAPLVLMLVEGCQCQQLIAATVATAPAGVRVVLVGTGPPPAPTNLGPADLQPLRLGDPAGTIRDQLALDPPGDSATVLLINSEGRVQQTVPRATSLAQYQAELTNLS